MKKKPLIRLFVAAVAAGVLASVAAVAVLGPAPGVQAPAVRPASLPERIREHLPFRGRADEPLPALWQDAELVATGTLEPAQYLGVGEVRILADGAARSVVLERFDVDFAPGLVVLLSPAEKPTVYAELGQAQVLGELRAAAGRQVFPVSAGVEVEAFGSVVIADAAEQVVLVCAPLVFRL
jgi:hypothetical protein